MIFIKNFYRDVNLKFLIKTLFLFFVVYISFLKLCLASNENNKECKCNYKNFGIIISGPSGVGKTTLIEKLLERQDSLQTAISATTRQKRIGEIDNKSYYFLTISQFKDLIKKDEFIEYANNYGNYYGSPRRNYIEAIENNKDIIFALSVDGMKNAKKNKKMDFITIFIAPDNEKTLYNRLQKRGTESDIQVKRRISEAKKEMNEMNNYDYIVYNIDIENAVNTIEAIYLAEQRKREICSN